MDIQELVDGLERYLELNSESGSRYSVQGLYEVEMGWEKELLVFKAVSSKQDMPNEMVLRVFSGESSSSKAEKEFYLMKRLYDVGYPVPEVYYLSLDGAVIGKPFIVMEYIDGATLDSVYSPDSSDGINRPISLFVELHNLDVDLFEYVPGLSMNKVESLLDSARAPHGYAH